MSSATEQTYLFIYFFVAAPIISLLSTHTHRWILSHQSDRQEPGGLLRPVPASGVPARGPVRRGGDEGQRAGAAAGRGGQGRQRFSLLPQI